MHCSALTPHDQFVELVRFFDSDNVFFCFICILRSLIAELISAAIRLLIGCSLLHSECGQALELYDRRTCWSAWCHARMRISWRHAWLCDDGLHWSCRSWWISKWLWWSSRSRWIAVRLYYRSTTSSSSKWCASTAAVHFTVRLLGNWCVSALWLTRRKAL